jgi:hypothetical protein
MLDQIVIAARPDVPLLAVSSRNVFVWKSQVKVFAVATSALCRPYAFVVFREL